MCSASAFGSSDSYQFRGGADTFQLGVDGGSAGEIGVEGGLPGVHRVLRGVIDDVTMNALFDQEAKSYLIVMSLKICWRHFGVSDTLTNRINVGDDDGNRHCQAGPHRRPSASRGL